MRILSTKLNLIKNTTDEQFYNVIIRWLKTSGPCKSIGEEFETCTDKLNTHLSVDYCKIDTLSFKDDEYSYNLFRLIHVFHEQTWTTEVILKTGTETKAIYFHVDCLGDATRFDGIPEIRSTVIRTFLDSGFVKQPLIPITASPLDFSLPQTVAITVEAIREEYTGELPLIIITTYFGIMASEIDEETLAKKLAGMAYVVKCTNEDTHILQDRAQRTAPYNGAVALYTKGGKPKIYRKNDAYHGASIETLILQEVLKIVTAQVDMEAPTWNMLYSEQIGNKSKKQAEMLDFACSENGTLDEQLKKAKARIAELTWENIHLKAKADSLESALKNNTDGGILQIGELKEFFEGEKHDFVVTVLTTALSNFGEKDTRKRELLNDILMHNKIIGKGKEIFETVKSVFMKGEELSSKDWSTLRSIGFEVVSENTHYKLVYKGNEKYSFPVAKTPSDNRSGKNLTSDIIKKISVYR